ncbi:hypothetical protein GCM10020258_23310 [Sphingomonas yabuuchiae]
MFDLDSYLARIALPSRVTVDAEGLGRLQWAHRQAIPFENIDVRLGRAIAIDSAGVFAKLVTAKRGGYCFEQNRLFLDALAAHGFHARPLLARVWLAATDVPPTTHTLSLVHIEGQDWIADAGFGGSYLPSMPLVEGAEATAPDGALFRLDRDPQHGWMVLRNGHPGLTDGRATGEGGSPSTASPPTMCGTPTWRWPITGPRPRRRAVSVRRRSSASFCRAASRP